VATVQTFVSEVAQMPQELLTIPTAQQQVKVACVLKVAEVEFLIAAQVPMPIAVLWQVDFITHWV
jgi:hypothetical protein